MDAVFAANDQMAVGALQTLARRSIKVPDTLAVVGYDDIPEAAYVWPPLTTIRQDFFRYGYSSVSELVKLIEAYQSERSVIDHHSMVIEPELIVRESSSMSKNRR
jgi:DNA-binding LacI/PurR family transcriptional regulator